MKKKFINDPVGFGVLFFLLFVAFVLLFLSLVFAHTQPNPIAVRIICPLVFGPMILVLLVYLFIRTEIIFVDDHHIKQWCAFKKTTISLSEAFEITESSKYTYRIDNMKYPSWKITNTLGVSIFIVQNKRRENLIKFIQISRHTNFF